MERSLPFYFSNLRASHETEVFCARLDPNINFAKHLLEALYYLLWFPGYFGFNWNALWDCLCDLTWMPYRKIHLIHEELPKLSEEELKIYLEILGNAVLKWKSRDSRFEVIFNETDQQRVEQLLADIRLKE